MGNREYSRGVWSYVTGGNAEIQWLVKSGCSPRLLTTSTFTPFLHLTSAPITTTDPKCGPRVHDNGHRLQRTDIQCEETWGETRPQLLRSVLRFCHWRHCHHLWLITCPQCRIWQACAGYRVSRGGGHQTQSLHHCLAGFKRTTWRAFKNLEILQL